MTIREQLNSIAEKRILILDGAMGSIIQALNLNERDFKGSRFTKHPTSLEGCNDVLCLSKPDAIGAIHDAYLEAGADIIETCSFNATSISLSAYGVGHLSHEISEAAAQIARKSADKFSGGGAPRFVAGSIGPTAKGASLYPDVNDPGKRSIVWDELEAAYYDNARGLLDGGADILLIETIFDTLNAKAALFAVSRLLEERQADVPIMISAAVSGESGRLLSGQSIEAFCVSVLHAKPWAIGLNCSLNAKKLMPFVHRLSKTAPCLVSAYPNAGLPNRLGRYEETAEMMSADIGEYLKEGLVNIIGGCCGSTPAHIAAIAKTAAGQKPRGFSGSRRRGLFAGLETLYTEENAIRITGTGNDAEREEFLRLFKNGEYEDAVDTARDIVENGADDGIINIETDDANAVSKFLDFALMNPYVAKAPFFINSLRFDVIETALKRLQGRGIAGPLNLKDGEAEFLRRAHLVLRYGAAAAVTLADEQGQAETCERGIEIARRAFNLLQNSGYPAENIRVVRKPPVSEQLPLKSAVLQGFSLKNRRTWRQPTRLSNKSIVFFPDPASPFRDQVCSWIRDNCPDVLFAL